MDEKITFIEQSLGIKFGGESKEIFIAKYYEDAVLNFEEAKEAYYGNFDY